MPVIEISLRGRPYRLTVEAGQEDHVRAMARVVETRVSTLSPRARQANDVELLFLAAITFAHDLDAAARNLHTDRTQGSEGATKPPPTPRGMAIQEVGGEVNGAAQSTSSQGEALGLSDRDMTLAALAHLQDRLSRLAERLEG